MVVCKDDVAVNWLKATAMKALANETTRYYGTACLSCENTPEGLSGEDRQLLLSEGFSSSLCGINCSSGTDSDIEATPFVGVSGLLVSLRDFCHVK